MVLPITTPAAISENGLLSIVPNPMGTGKVGTGGGGNIEEKEDGDENEDEDMANKDWQNEQRNGPG